MFGNSILLARSASSRYAGCEHFVSPLQPLALEWGKISLGFLSFSNYFLSHITRVRNLFCLMLFFIQTK